MVLSGKRERENSAKTISGTVRTSVEAFFLSPEISREIPLKKEAIKVKDVTGSSKTVQKNVMVMSVQEAFGAYKSKFSENKVGLTTFKSLKPKNVKKVSETNRRTCLCTICSNVSLKVEAIRKFSSSILKEKPDKLKELQYLSSLTKSELPSCKSCNKVSDFLAPLKSDSNESITLCHWEYICIKRGDENKRQISCVEKSTSISSFLEAIDIDLKTYPLHMFRANWQHRQMAENQRKLKEGEIQLVMDFSENYRCAFKDEVQTGFLIRFK